MNYIDIFILIILLIGGLNGLRHGFVKAFANLIGWIFALILGAKYANLVAPAMSALSQDPVVQKIAAFAFIVMVIIVSTWIITALLNGILKTLKLGPLNRLAGGAFGTLKGLMVVLITMQGLGSFVESSPHWKQSKMIQFLLPFAPMATEFSKETASKAFDEMKPEEDSEIKSHFDSAQNDQKKSENSSSNSTKNPFY